MSIPTIPVTRIMNAATSAGHVAVELGGLTAMTAVVEAAAHTDVLQNPTLNRITGGRAATWQGPVDAALGTAAGALPGAIDTAHAGVTVLGVAGKQYGWAANNVIRATDAARRNDDALVEDKLALAQRQVDRGARDLQKLGSL